MITVQIDGSSMVTDVGEMKTLGDLVELVKTTIDPDAIITSMSFDKDGISERDWMLPLVAHNGRTLSVTTGSKSNFLDDRLRTAEFFLDQIMERFNNTANTYDKGTFDEANRMFAGALEDLSAFLEWYGSLLMVDEKRMAATTDAYAPHIEAISRTCEELHQHQLYNSWWVLSNTLRTKLKPELQNLRAFCLESAGDQGRRQG